MFLSNYLEKEAKKGLVACLTSVIFALALLVVGTAARVTTLIASGAIAFMVAIFVVARYGPIYSTHRCGIDGERILRARLLSSGLSDEYTAYYNVPMNHGSGISDVDCILVGPSGMYLFEVKHHHGLILHRNGNWARIKVGHRGTPYRGQVGNPSRQLSRNIRNLKELLGQNLSNGLWLHGAVVFTNPRAVLDVEGLRWVRAIAVQDLEQILSKRMVLSAEQIDSINARLAAFIKK